MLVKLHVLVKRQVLVMLTFKQRRFCLEYFKDGNASKAALRAGYGADYAPKAGSELLQKQEVQAEIAEHEADAAAVAGLTQARVIREMMAIAFPKVHHDPCVYCWPENLVFKEPNVACVKCYGRGVAIQTKNGIEVKLRDQTPILLALGKIVGLMPEKLELAGPGGGPIQIESNDVRELTEAQLEVIARMGVDMGVVEGQRPLTLEGSV